MERRLAMRGASGAATCDARGAEERSHAASGAATCDALGAEERSRAASGSATCDARGERSGDLRCAGSNGAEPCCKNEISYSDMTGGNSSHTTAGAPNWDE